MSFVTMASRISRKAAGRLAAIIFVMTSVSAATAGEIVMEYEFSPPVIEEITAGSTSYHRLVMADAPGGGRPGTPSLPARGAQLLIPYGETVTGVDILPGEEVSLGSGYLIEPVGIPFPLSADPSAFSAPVRDSAVYSLAVPYPEKKGETIGRHRFRGYDILILRLHPVRYTPASGDLSYYPHMKVVVHTGAAAKTSSLFRGLPEDAAEIIDRVDNPELAVSYQAAGRPGADNYDMLILTVPGLEAAFLPLKEYHDSTGILTEIRTITDVFLETGGGTPEHIRDYIRNRYLNDGIRYVLLGDDHGLIPGKMLYIEAEVYTAGGSVVDYTMPSDIYYACLDGTYDFDGDGLYGEPTDGEGGGDVDLVGEVCVGRAAVDNAADVARFVSKTIQYASSQDAYLDRVLVCGERIGTPDNELKYYADASMEEIIDGSDAHSYTTAGIPSDLYTIDRLYDHTWPTRNWPPSEIIDRINSGRHIVNHLGHCIYYYALKLYLADLSQLVNTDPCFIYSQGCYAGGFDTLDVDCWAEQVTVKTDAGAFAAIMNTRFGWAQFADHPITTDGASQRFNREFWDAVFNPAENKPELGRANQDSKEDNLYRINDGAMRWVYYEVTLFGDPSIAIKRPYGIAFDYPLGIPEVMTPGQGETFQVAVTGLYGGIPISGSGQLHYRMNDGDVQTAAMTELLPNLYEAALPAIDCGDEMTFYVSAQEAAGLRLYDPPPDSAHTVTLKRRLLIAFEDDFETDRGWAVSGGLWARGIPAGGGGEHGWPDPAAGCNGPSVYGYNLDGDYENNLGEMHLTSPPFDCSLLRHVHLQFDRWLGVEQIPWDHARLAVSTDGTAWTTIWENPGIVADADWIEMDYDISDIAAGQETVKLRWTMGPTNFAWRLCGWNIDDVRVVGYDCLGYFCGDANGDESINVGDAVFIVNYVFRNGAPPGSTGMGDANGDGMVNIGDAVFLINYVFKNGPVPQCAD